MFLSMNWIKDFVDLSGLDELKLINQFSLSTAEVENDIQFKGSDISGIVVAEIKSVENHPESPRQRVPMMGAKPDLTSVCPVLKSLPAMGWCIFSASSHIAGISTVVLGAPMIKGAPSESAA